MRRIKDLKEIAKIYKGRIIIKRVAGYVSFQFDAGIGLAWVANTLEVDIFI